MSNNEAIRTAEAEKAMAELVQKIAAAIDGVEKQSWWSHGNYMNACAKAAIAAMGDDSARKDECACVVSAPKADSLPACTAHFDTKWHRVATNAVRSFSPPVKAVSLNDAANMIMAVDITLPIQILPDYLHYKVIAQSCAKAWGLPYVD